MRCKNNKKNLFNQALIQKNFGFSRNFLQLRQRLITFSFLRINSGVEAESRIDSIYID